jgi:hypothetical protein
VGEEGGQEHHQITMGFAEKQSATKTYPLNPFKTRCIDGYVESKLGVFWFALWEHLGNNGETTACFPPSGKQRPSRPPLDSPG